MPEPCSQIIITRPFAFSAPEYVTVPMGLTVAEIVRNIHAQAGVPVSWQSSALVMVNGDVIVPDMWEHLIPATGSNVVVSTSLHGGGGGGKNPLRTLLTIAVVVAASMLGPTAGVWAVGQTSASMTFATAEAIGSAAIMFAGMALVNAIAPIRPPALQGSASRDSAESPTYSLTGGSNDIRRFAPVPVVLGRHQMTPPLGAMSYTEIIGNDEYLRMLVIWGYGPLQIREIKIGETLITEYQDLEIQTVEGWSDDPAMTLFPSDVYQDQIGTGLTSAAGWIQRTSQPNADELSVDIIFPRGLTVFNDAGNRTDRTIEIELRYRKVGDVSWTSPVATVTHIAQTATGFDFSNASTHYGVYVNSSDGVATYSTGTGTVAGKLLVGEIYQEWVVTGWYESEIGEYQKRVLDYTAPGTTGFVCSLSGADVSITAGTITTAMLTTTRATAQAVRVGHKWNVENGYQYEVAIRRTTADSTDDKIIDDCVWSVLRTFQVGSPINFRQPLAMTALRIKATEQLSGAISNLNATVMSYANIWDGTDWDTVRTTNNPAALMRLVLMGPANERRRSLSQIDQDNLAEFYEFCGENSYAFNMVRDFVSSVWNTCADIAASGRASVTLNNGKWGAVMDIAGRPVRQHFTPRNSWGFESTKLLSIQPHAWRVRFVNEDEGYKQDERIVYADGYTSTNATKFEGLEFPGITDPDLIWKFGRFHLAQLQLRPEEYSLSCGMEHLACQRGDVVLVSHDVPMWGLGWGRVKELTMDGLDIVGVVVDEGFIMEVTTSYNVRFRLDDGTSYVRAVTTVVGENYELLFAEATTENIQVGDLAIFGEAGTETQRLLVKGITRGENLSAQMTLVDEGPSIYTADTGVIPEFNSNITLQPNLTEIPPVVPLITGITSGTSALVLIGSNLISRILVSLSSGGGNIRANENQIRYRAVGNLEWQFFSAPSEESTIAIWPVQDGLIYEIQARSLNVYGYGSDWSSVYTHIVIGQTEVPPDVTGFTVNVVGAEAHISWVAVSVVDLSHYEIRWSSLLSGASWNSSVVVDSHVDGTSTTLPAQVGTYLIKAIDRMGNASAATSVAITNIAKLAGLNIIEAVTNANPTWSGTMTDVTYDSGIGGVILDGSELGYYYLATGVDLGGVYTSRVSGSMVVEGGDLGQDLYTYDDLYALDNIYGVSDDQYGAALDIRFTSDDPSGSPTWSSWTSLIVGDYTARAFEARVMLSGSGTVTPILSSVTLTVDMPDRLYRFSSDIASGGTRVDFDPAFYEFSGDRGLGISVTNGAEGDNYLITNLDETGFDIAFTNGGSGVARRISGIAQSYGEVSV